MDQSNRGWISFSDFVSALSTIYRGDKDDVLAFWFKMYDSDRDGFLDRQVSALGVCWGVAYGRLLACLLELFLQLQLVNRGT